MSRNANALGDLSSIGKLNGLVLTSYSSRSSFPARPEARVLVLRLPFRQDPQVYVLTLRPTPKRTRTFPSSFFKILTRCDNRQLGREGQAQKDRRYRPHALPQGRLQAIQERFPGRPAQGRARSREQGQVLRVNASTTPTTMAKNFFGVPESES